MIFSWRMLLIQIFFFEIPTASSLGINCRGSGVCPLATLFAGSKGAGQDIVQGLLNTISHTTLPDSTTYGNGDHIACVSNTIPISLSVGPPFVSVSLGGGIPAGGICAFPQSLPSGTTLNLAQIKNLAEDIIQHGCNTCGSVPITYPDNQDVDKVGQLTFNFVSEGKVECDGTCISAVSNTNMGTGNGDTIIVTVPAAITTPIVTAPITSPMVTTPIASPILSQRSSSTTGPTVMMPTDTVTQTATTTVSGPATVTVIVSDAGKLDFRMHVGTLIFSVLAMMAMGN